MFSLDMLTPYKGEIKKLQFKKNQKLCYDGDPRMWGMGHYVDAEGIKWDVGGIANNQVLARRVDNSYIYSTASGGPSCCEFYEWIPYDVEMVD